MDFLKACTTNIHVVEGLAETAFSLYRLKDERAGNAQKLREARKAATHLRHEKVLCAIVEQDICIFGDEVDAEHFLNLEEKYDLVDEGALRSLSEVGSQDARDIFLDAIEHAIAFSVATEPAITYIAPWTWLYHDSEAVEGDVSSTIKLHTQYTLSGSLLLVPEITPATWLPIDRAAHAWNSSILLAPHGVPARVMSETSNKIGSDDAWKASVVEALQSNSTDIGTDSAWIPVELTNSPEIGFLWPQQLCLVSGTVQMADARLVEAGNDWRRWSAGFDDQDAFQNPLAIAEEWFKGAAAREQAAQSEFAAAPVDSPARDLDAPPINASTTANDATVVTSPPFMQRALDQHVAMSGIYPTPPDGMAQAPPTNQINTAATPSMTQAEIASYGAELMPTISGNSQSNGADSNPPADRPEEYQLDQEDLFGDVAGEMEFGEDEAVDDADFNFFDEPDDEPHAEHPGVMEMEDEPIRGQEAAAQSEKECEPAGTNAIDATDDVAPVTSDHATESASTHDEADTSNAVGEDEPPMEHQALKPEKALSPFDVKERLLPPPIPASLANTESKDFARSRRHSTFAPIVFKNSFNLGPKYADTGPTKDDARSSMINSKTPNISLPPIRKKSRHLRQEAKIEHRTTESNTESEEDSYESTSTESDDDADPPRLPWDTLKRKRVSKEDHLQPRSGSFERMWSDDESDNDAMTSDSQHDMSAFLERCLTGSLAEEEFGTPASRRHPLDSPKTSNYAQAAEESVVSIHDIERLYSLRKEDLIYVAQIISEQSISAFWSTSSRQIATSNSDTVEPGKAQSLYASITTAVESLFPEVETCDLAQLAATRDPASRPGTMPTKTPQGQPRMPQRADSQLILGPDCFVLPSPYVRIQRGADNWEMLPTCLAFWETLGIGPARGTKNVRAFCVFPSNDGLQRLLEQFVGDLGTSYENCKLGSHIHIRNTTDTETDNFENGMAPVEFKDDEQSVEGLLKAYATTCVELGKLLSTIGYQETDRTIVVYMVNPFSDRRALQHLCACFWLLFKAYRDNVAKAQRNQGGSDIVLQVLPIEFVASLDGIVVPEAGQMALLAREVYDRCPPASSQTAESLSALPILAAPSVELANSAPKRIGFQLAAEPPSDLLHEGSVLHLAYACSQDGEWLTAAWIDNTGQHQSSASFCLRGKAFVDVAEDVWEHTREILSARSVTWRVFIVTPDVMDTSLSQCWRTISSRRRPQPLCVTLLSVQLDPILHLSSPVPPPDSQLTWPNPDASFLTPASTPQASTLTSSPNMPNDQTAPPTPAPSESAIAIAENDPDAQLTDLTDETWGLILSPKLAPIASAYPGLANGALYKRGEPNPGEPLPSLIASVHWTIQVKPSGGVDDGSAKQAELTLREVLKMYRNLALLTKARGLESGRTKFAPVHVAMAVRGVEGLEGMLEKEKGARGGD